MGVIEPHQQELPAGREGSGAALPAVSLIVGGREPVDGVWDYCENLRVALAQLGVGSEILMVPWRSSRVSAMRALRGDWHGKVAILQYTAFSWSRRGLAVGLVPLVAYLRARGARVAVMFHDPYPHVGSALKHRARELAQTAIMRGLVRAADASVHNLPLEAVGWLRDRERAVYVPVGSNFPESETKLASVPVGAARRIGVFGFTPAPVLELEVEDVAKLVRKVAISRPELKLEVLAFGHGASEAEAGLRQALDGTNVELTVRGVGRRAEVADWLSSCHALLFQRDAVSTQRTTAMAAIAAGLPLVGYAAERTVGPVTEAGILTGPRGDLETGARNLTAVLTDAELWGRLHEASLRAQERHFSWRRIAGAYVDRVLRSA